MNKASTNLFFARWLYPEPEYGWIVNWEGKVAQEWPNGPDVNGEHQEYFDIHNPRDREKVMIKLQRDFGWKLHQKPDGTWVANDGKGKSIENPDLVTILGQLVESLEAK